MVEADSNVFIEDLVLYAMRRRNKDWKRTFLNIKDDDPDIRRIFTPEIGKTVMYFAEQESWNYMDVVHSLIQELLPDKRFCYGKITYCLTDVGKKFLDWERKDTLFSYSAMIVEVCCYCWDRGYHSLIEAAILAAGMAINEKIVLPEQFDQVRYHQYAVEYNKIHEETFKPGEKNLSLKFISNPSFSQDF